MKKAFIIIIVIIILGAAGYYLFKHNLAKAPANEAGPYQSQQLQNNVQPPVATATPSGKTQTINNAGGKDYTPSSSPTGGETTGSNIQVYEVDFDGSAYSPAVSKLHVGDYLFIKNKSGGDFWPVAGSANTVAAFPDFNPAAALPAGKEYKFQFTKAGDFSFGDNLKANEVFEVKVSQ